MAGSLRLTYVGHATVLIELDGVRILTDPILRNRVGPLRRRGSSPSPADLGPIDVALISHAHPDHFDRASLRAIPGDPVVITPRGLGRRAKRVAHDVREVIVGDQVDIGDITITAIAARHPRWPLERVVRPLGYLIEGSSRVYFAGDTAPFAAMSKLAGRVDVALLPVGRWGPPVGPARLTPRTAVSVARQVGAKIAIPIHWGTLYVPGFEGGRWGWGSIDAAAAFEREGAAVPDVDVIVLQPGEGREIEP
jgi:L-ascorbate metabolism protein UlaG (beta-lactamase superfamily)